MSIASLKKSIKELEAANKKRERKKAYELYLKNKESK